MTAHRKELIAQAIEAVSIAKEGAYVSPSGRRVTIADAVAAACAGRVDHPPDELLSYVPVPRFETEVRVVNATSLEAGQRLGRPGDDVLILNFASALSPGGGFLTGAVAQEESLARSSALYVAIAASPMYAFHAAQDDPFYSDWMIWSPRVPVFREERTGALLETPWQASFLTAAAPMAFEVRAHHPSRVDELAPTMHARIARSLALSAMHGHTKLVLGAWGCGAFGNDVGMVADAYKELLTLRYAGVFDEVVFAVLDHTPERRFMQPFVDRFC